MHTKPTSLAVLLTAIAAPAHALADDLAPAAQIEASTRQSRDFALTVSPAHLVLPVAEVTGEYRVTDGASAAVIGGIGFSDELSIFELGSQLRWYALGSFEHGLQLGAELLYVHVRGDGLIDDDLEVTGAGLAAGPFVGYKYTADVGFTVDVQAGAQYLAIATDDGDDEDTDSSVIPLLNLNVGWSF